MFKRLTFAFVGLGAGVTLGMWAVRKLERTRSKLSPEHLGGAAAARAGSLRDRLALAVEEGRRAAASKETELRALYGRGMDPEPEPAPPVAGGDPVDPDAL